MKYTVAKIQSISDIITNSSSEAFMVITPDTLEQYKMLAQDVLNSFGIQEPIDNVLITMPKIDDSDKKLIKHFILTGHLLLNCYDEFDIEKAESEENYKIIEGYPVCVTEEEITDEIFAKAAAVYNENTNIIAYHEGYPIITGIYFKEKSPEYKQIAEALTNLICFEADNINVFYN